MGLNKLYFASGLVASGLLMPIQSSASPPIAATSPAGFPGTATPVEANCSRSELRVTVTALPSDGTVLLANGFTPVRLRQTLSLAQLETLKYRPAQSSEAGPPASYSVLSVPQNSGARTVGIRISTSEAYAIMTELPSNGSVLFQDGTTAVARGQTLTAAQLKRLRFKPAVDAAGQISNLSYLVVGPAGSAVAGCVLLIVGPTTPPVDRRLPHGLIADEYQS